MHFPCSIEFHTVIAELPFTHVVFQFFAITSMAVVAIPDHISLCTYVTVSVRDIHTEALFSICCLPCGVQTCHHAPSVQQDRGHMVNLS